MDSISLCLAGPLESGSGGLSGFLSPGGRQVHPHDVHFLSCGLHFPCPYGRPFVGGRGALVCPFSRSGLLSLGIFADASPQLGLYVPELALLWEVFLWCDGPCFLRSTGQPPCGPTWLPRGGVCWAGLLSWGFVLLFSLLGGGWCSLRPRAGASGVSWVVPRCVCFLFLSGWANLECKFVSSLMLILNISSSCLWSMLTIFSIPRLTLVTADLMHSISLASLPSGWCLCASWGSSSSDVSSSVLSWAS